MNSIVRHVLSFSALSAEHVDTLVNNVYVQNLFNMATTHHSTDAHQNYEILEFLGDSIVNTAVTWYIFKRFPEIKDPKNLRVLSRMRINLVCTSSFAYMADKMGLKAFVPPEMHSPKIMEDVFEALMGATFRSVEEHLQEGAGNLVVYTIIKGILDTKYLSLHYNDITEAKSRLKEMFDRYSTLGKLQYQTVRNESTNMFDVTINLCSQPEMLGKPIMLRDNIPWTVPETSVYPIGHGSGATKIKAETLAAERALEILKGFGVSYTKDDWTVANQNQ